MNKEIKEILDHFENSSNEFSEYSIVDAFHEKKIDLASADVDDRAELIAFRFCEEYGRKNEEGWGTYYGPMMVWRNNDGAVEESPNLSAVNKDIIAVWEKRAKESRHPILKARYADLVWDLSKVATGHTPNHGNAQIAIDANIEIIKMGQYKRDSLMVKKLRRACSLARSINDAPRLQRCKLEVIAYQQQADDDKPGLWEPALDILLSEELCTLSDDEQNLLILDINKRIERLTSDNERVNPWSIEGAALRLAGCYRKKGDDAKVDHYLKVIERAYESKCQTGSPLQVCAWWQRVHDLYLEFNQRGDAERVRQRIAETGPAIKDALETFEVSVEVPTEKLDRWLVKLTNGGIAPALEKLTRYFVPKRSEVEEQLEGLSERAPLSFLFSTTLLDSRGRAVAHIGSLEGDLDGHVINQTSKNLLISSFCLRKAIESIQEKHAFGSENLCGYLKQAPIFDRDREQLLIHGIDLYFKGDFISSIHVLIPQIEAAMRRLLELSGQGILKVARNGGYFYKTFDEILRDPIITQVFGDDAALYFRILFTDHRGWNLRNDVCHGLAGAEVFDERAADRLIHVLLMLGIVRETARQDDS